MEILGVGPLEFVFVVIILLLVLGPTELATLGKRTGQFIRKVRESETWILLANLASTLRNLPNTLADEVGMDQILEDVIPAKNRRSLGPNNRIGDPLRRPSSQRDGPAGANAYSAWTTPPDDGVEPAPDGVNPLDASAGPVHTVEPENPAPPEEDKLPDTPPEA